MQLKQNINRKSIKHLAFEDPKDIMAKTLLAYLLILSMIYIGLLSLVNSFGYNMNNILYNGLLSLSAFAVTLPLFLNLMNMYLMNSHDELISFTDLFKIKRNSFKFTWYFLLICLGYFIITFILDLIPVIGFISNTILVIFMLPVFFVMPLVFIQNSSLSFKEFLKNSLQIVSGHRVKFYGLLFSFIGWYILGIFTLGILYFWLIPYTLISLTYLYINIQENKEFKKEESLSNETVIILFTLGFIIFNIISFVNIPSTFDDFKTSLGINSFTKNNASLSYGGEKIEFYVPKNYELKYKSSNTKTYVKDDMVLQYSIYLTSIKEAIKMDKEISSKYKNVSSSEFTLKKGKKNIKGYMYKGQNGSTKLSVVTIYEEKGDFILTTSLSSFNDLSKDDINKVI